MGWVMHHVGRYELLCPGLAGCQGTHATWTQAFTLTRTYAALTMTSDARDARTARSL